MLLPFLVTAFLGASQVLIIDLLSTMLIVATRVPSVDAKEYSPESEYLSRRIRGLFARVRVADTSGIWISLLQSGRQTTIDENLSKDCKVLPQHSTGCFYESLNRKLFILCPTKITLSACTREKFT
uniref:Uncharacterized protein n=1 Tax=Pseudictyota dubia TaxID=2749911 RepID=A0A7R9Z6Q8_9STRA